MPPRSAHALRQALGERVHTYFSTVKTGSLQNQLIPTQITATSTRHSSCLISTYALNLTISHAYAADHFVALIFMETICSSPPRPKIRPPSKPIIRGFAGDRLPRTSGITQITGM